MRVLMWHGWLLEGSGSNVYTARVTEILRREGHDVLLLCQQADAEGFAFIDASGTASVEGVSELAPTGAAPARGRAVLLRPRIELLPVFVDEYSELPIKRFVDLSFEELETYIARNTDALAAAAEWHGSQAVMVGHAVAGPAIARRALGPGGYVAKLHGSDLEYAVRLQDRYLELAREGLEGARAVVGTSDDVIERAVSLIPTIAGRMVKIAPGVDVDRFRLMPRREALEGLAAALSTDPEIARGRPASLDAQVRAAVERRDAAALEALPRRYDQTVPDPDAHARVRALAGYDGALLGYFGKLIVQKGVERLIEATARSSDRAHAMVIGFGLFREWLEALVTAFDADESALEWLRDASGMQLERLVRVPGLTERVTFTGRLDHRYAPAALAALDVQVVPSTLEEAFGMVAAEGAAAGALPLVARHSGLAEVASALETEVGRSGLFSFEPGDGATGRVEAGIQTILALPDAERAELREAISRYVGREWTWDHTAQRLLETAK